MPRQLIVVMGPSGCGKSSVSAALAETIGAPMLEGDDFHSDKNRTKMASGHPLTDSDRAGWLDAIWHALEAHLAPRLLLACSALTPYVQSRLREASNRDIRFVLLDVPRDVLAERLERRTDHFMPPALLDSQIEALKVPQDAIVIDASQSVDAIVAEVVSQLEN